MKFIKEVSLLSLIIACATFLFSPQLVKADTCTNQDPCWTAKAPLPTALARSGIAADSSGKIYVVGGGNQDGITNLSFMYNPSTDTWTTKAPLPVQSSDGGFAYSSSIGKFYFAGGFSHDTYLKGVYEYNPVTDTWTQKASMNQARAAFDLVSAPNGKLYAIGGLASDGSTRLAEVEEYNPTTDTWTSNTSLPTPRAQLGVVTAPNGKIYAIGGHIDPGVGMTTVEEYDPTTNTWATKTAMPTPRSDFAISLNLEGKIDVIEGISDIQTSPYTYNHTVEEYNPSTDTWAAKTALPMEVTDARAALGGDRIIHVFGGFTDTPSFTIFNTNYAAIPEVTVNAIDVATSPVQVNSSVTASATFTDSTTSSTHTAQWNWGDGTTPTAGAVTESNGSGSVTGTHTYSVAGVYTVTLTVANTANGASGAAQYQYVVVYDPGAGWVSGSKEFTSPAGAVTGNTGATGTANFGFQVKYANGAMVPSGKNVSLNFPAGNISFMSTSYQWLVVSGSKATFKANGTLNGTSGYTILVSAIDQGNGQPKGLIRFQIKDASNTVIYDTQPGAGDTADPTISLTKGQIAVH